MLRSERALSGGSLSLNSALWTCGNMKVCRCSTSSFESIWLMSLDTVAWTRQLDRSVPSCRELPMVYVSLMCVELDRTWTVFEPHGGAKRPTSSENRMSKTSSSSNNGFMIDSSSTTYSLSHSAQVDLLPPSSSATGDFESAQPYIADCSSPSPSSDGASPPYERLGLGLGHLRPLRTTTLVRVPGDAGFTSIAMLHLHQLHATRSHGSSLTPPLSSRE